ncbi:MAG TPA: biotin/lipoyl-binding protein, partial [Methylococcales bacterium]
VTVEGYRKTVQHLEGGIVKAIHVRDGDTVSKGQVLIELDDTSSRAQLETLRGQLYSAFAREARLITERDGKPALAYPANLINAAATDPRAREDMRVQNQSFAVRQRSRAGEIAILKEQRGQLLAKIEGIKAQRISRSNLSSSLNKELVDFRAMLKEGYVEKQKVNELERRLTESEGDRGDFVANIATAQTQISEIEIKILQFDKDFQ